jgi:hypothetical protein
VRTSIVGLVAPALGKVVRRICGVGRVPFGICNARFEKDSPQATEKSGLNIRKNKTTGTEFRGAVSMKRG